MKNNTTFAAILLAAGPVFIRKAWVNTNSKKGDQVSIQMFQVIKSSSEGPGLIGAISQGIEGAGTQKVTAIQSVRRDIAEKALGHNFDNGDLDFSNVGGGTDQAVPASILFGDTEVNIQVTENFTPNAFAKNHEPKMNPSTEEVVEAVNPATGQASPVYRHTELVAGDANHKYVSTASSSVEATASSAIEEATA